MPSSVPTGGFDSEADRGDEDGPLLNLLEEEETEDEDETEESEEEAVEVGLGPGLFGLCLALFCPAATALSQDN